MCFLYWRQCLPFLVSAVLFWVVLEVWAMSELAWGVTLVFTVSPFPFPFLSPFALPLGTSAISFWVVKGIVKTFVNTFWISDIHLNMHELFISTTSIIIWALWWLWSTVSIPSAFIWSALFSAMVKNFFGSERASTIAKTKMIDYSIVNYWMLSSFPIISILMESEIKSELFFLCRIFNYRELPVETWFQQ